MTKCYEQRQGQIQLAHHQYTSSSKIKLRTEPIKLLTELAIQLLCEVTKLVIEVAKERVLPSSGLTVI